VTAESLANPDVRAGLYRKLKRRNRLVDVLRVLVPLAGAALLGFLVAQIIIANLAKDFGITGIRLERDRLLIETPQYEGVMENGTRYKLVADTASALLSRSDVIELGNATLDLLRSDGVAITVTTERAFYDIVSQTVEIPEVAHVVDSRRTRARLYDTHVDWAAQTVNARTGAEVVFADGTELTAATLMLYSAENRWDMTGVTLVTMGEGEGT